MKIKIIEAQTKNSTRAGTTHEVKNIATAKRIASRNQMFVGTVLRIEDMSGNIIAVKECGEWTGEQ